MALAESTFELVVCLLQCCMNCLVIRNVQPLIFLLKRKRFQEICLLKLMGTLAANLKRSFS